MDSELMDAWYSPEWFMPSTLKAFSWEYPVFLYLLLAAPLLFIVRWLLRYYFNQKLPVAVSQKDLKTSPLNLVRLLPEFLLMLSLMLMLTALARPQKTNEKVEQWTEGIDIMIALDISQSMQIEDFTPNRLEAAKKVALNFIQGRVQDRIGLVVFSGDAFSLAPLTTDYDLLRSYINEINFEMIENRGTAIGSAMAVVTNRMRESESKSKVCILLSDGDNTAGNIDPITAAELASAYGIKVYTIVVGKEGLVPYGKDFFGYRRRTILQGHRQPGPGAGVCQDRSIRKSGDQGNPVQRHIRLLFHLPAVGRVVFPAVASAEVYVYQQRAPGLRESTVHSRRSTARSTITKELIS
jgi:Ca-activated chloride channel homolog